MFFFPTFTESLLDTADDGVIGPADDGVVDPEPEQEPEPEPQRDPGVTKQLLDSRAWGRTRGVVRIGAGFGRTRVCSRGTGRNGEDASLRTVLG